MENWIEYLNEEEGKEVLSDSDGFIAYIISGQECYVSDLFIKRESRRSGLAIKMASNLEKIARERGCTLLTCNIFIKEKTRATVPHRIKIFSKFGFSVVSAGNNVITMNKGL